MDNPISLTNVTLYDDSNTAILKKAQANIAETRTQSAFTTNLEITGGEGSGQVEPGKTYYATGVGSDSKPFQSERVVCKSVGEQTSFSGEVDLGQSRSAERALLSDGADIKMTFSNMSETQFSRGQWGDKLPAGFTGLTETPGPVLKSFPGKESMGAGSTWTAFGEGPADIYVSWIDGAHTFGVWIHFNIQVWGMGYRPDWKVYDATQGGWVPSGSDPAYQFTWPSSIGYTIVAKPTSGHSSLLVDVTISKL